MRQKIIEVHYPESVIIPHVTSYNQKNPPYKKWFKELDYILKLNPKTENIAKKVMFVTRQNRNLQQQSVFLVPIFARAFASSLKAGFERDKKKSKIVLLLSLGGRFIRLTFLDLLYTYLLIFFKIPIFRRRDKVIEYPVIWSWSLLGQLLYY